MKLSAVYLPMGEDDPDTLHVDQWGGWIHLWAEWLRGQRSVGMDLLKIKLSALIHKVDHCVNHCCVSGKCFAGMLIPICWSA